MIGAAFAGFRKKEMTFGSNVFVGGTPSFSYGYMPIVNAFDNNPSTYTQNYNSTPFWIVYDFGNGISRCVTKYSIENSNQGAAYSPSDWLFQGGNDHTLNTWTTIESRSGISWSGTNVIKEFTCTNSTAYELYRFYFTAPNGPICIAELKAYVLS